MAGTLARGNHRRREQRTEPPRLPSRDQGCHALKRASQNLRIGVEAELDLGPEAGQVLIPAVAGLGADIDSVLVPDEQGRRAEVADDARLRGDGRGGDDRQSEQSKTAC